MKKKAISLLLVTAMVLSFALVAAPTVEAAEQQHPHGENTKHCSCGQAIDSAAITGHTHEAAAPTWTPWTSIADVTDGGHYYLTADYAKQSGNYIKVEKSFTLCLNGYTFYNKLDVHANMTVCDCSSTPGKVSSATSGTSTQGGVVQIRSAKFNLFNAELVYTGTGVSMGGCVAINGDSNSTFNMYSGKISGGKAVNGSKLGGSVFIGDKSKAAFNLYGGTVEGGTAKKGGSVYLHGQGALNIYGGTIESGTTTEASGTAIHSVYGVPTITYEGGSIIGGASGNVISYNNEETISLGITKMGLEIAENGSVGVGYITEFAMTDGMKAKLATSAEWNNSAYGLKVWVEGGTPQYASFGVDQDATVSSTHLKNIMNKDDNTVDDAANSIIPVKGVAYAVIGKTVVESATRSFTLKTLVEKMDANLTDDASLAILKDLYAFYENVMSGWTLTKINAA